MNKNLKILISAFAVSLWYNASWRLYELVVPNVDWKTTVIMFLVACAVLLYDDGYLYELKLFNDNDQRVIPKSFVSDRVTKI